MSTPNTGVADSSQAFWWCGIGWHKWTKWGEPHAVVVKAKPQPLIPGNWMYTTTAPDEWTEVWQARVCGACGALQNREVRKVRP